MATICFDCHVSKPEMAKERETLLECATTRIQVDPEEARTTNRLVQATLRPTNPCLISSISSCCVMLGQACCMLGCYVPLEWDGPLAANGCEKMLLSINETLRGDGQVVEAKRILVLGDSLVLGIGCREVDAHILAKSIASSVCKSLLTEVQWWSYGINGGDVQSVHRGFMQNHVIRVTEPSPPQDPRGFLQQAMFPHSDARIIETSVANHRDPNMFLSLRPNMHMCVVFCGLNDFKKYWRGHTPSFFYRKLKEMLLDLRLKLGAQCKIVLPGLLFEPVHLPEPLHSFVISLSAIFDRQKSRLAAEMCNVWYVPKPGPDWLQSVEASVGSLVAEDGVHPNERGYKAFADFLAQKILERMSAASD